MERISKLLLEYVFPTLEDEGFNYLKSQNEFKKKNDFFEFVVFWNGRKYNEGNISVKFDISLFIQSSKYRRWEKKFYNLEKNWKRPVYGARVEYIENWDKKNYYSGWYDLVKDDNEKVMESINDNIKKSAKVFFENFSTLESAICKLKESPIEDFESIFDFYIIQNKWNEALDFFDENKTWFEEQIVKDKNNPSESLFYLNRKEPFELRKEKIENWLQRRI